MDKMNYERGLISYTTEHSLEGKKTHVVRPKLFGYLAVILIMTVAFIWQITSRLPLELNIDRDRTALFRENSEGLIENTYTLLILNKSQHENTYVVNVEGLKSFEYFGEKEVNILAGEAFTLPISLAVDPYDLSKPVTNITITVTSKDGDVKVYEESRFFKGR